MPGAVTKLRRDIDVARSLGASVMVVSLADLEAVVNAYTGLKAAYDRLSHEHSWCNDPEVMGWRARFYDRWEGMGR